MKEKIMMFAIGILFAIVSLLVIDRLVGIPGAAKAQTTFEVEVINDVAGGSYFKSEIEKRLSEGYRVVGFSSYFIPSDQPGVVALLVK